MEGNLYTVVTWPYSQELMDYAGFENNSYLLNDDKALNDFGSGAYMVSKEWLDEVECGHVEKIEQDEWDI